MKTPTQKHMGRGELIKRLSAQVGSEKLAISILRKRGHVDKNGKLTEEGKKRDKMTAAERAKDRTSKRTGIPLHRLGYNPKTNRATKK